MSDDFDEVFVKLAVNSVIDDLEELVSKVLYLESMSRHVVACENDHEAAGAYAQEAYALFMGIPMATVPTFIMAVADRYNREREELLKVLDGVYEAERELVEVVTDDSILNLPVDQAAKIGQVRAKLSRILEEAPYARRDDAE